MIRQILIICTVAMLALFVEGCQTASQARVVRIMLNTNSSAWRLSVNGTREIAALSGSNLTNKLARLHLHHGDLVLLLGTQPSRTPSPVAQTWGWFWNYCHSNRVAVYAYGVYNPAAEADSFTIPVYHWVAPFRYPLDLDKASFFHEGELLGNSMNGFQEMLREIARTRPKKIFVLGSLYDMWQGLGPGSNPYDDQQKLLDKVLKESGTELILLDPILGFWAALESRQPIA